MPADKPRRRSCPCGCHEYDLPWSGRALRRSSTAPECDTAPPSAPERVIAAATGRRFDGYVSFKADTETSRELGGLEATLTWATRISATEEDEDGKPVGPPVQIAEARGTVVRVSPMNYLEFHDACDEISGDFEYMASVVLEHVEELGELGVLVDVFYLERVEVAPNLLGHRWGVRVAANLLQAISVDNLDRLIVAFAGMNEDPQDSPNRLAAQRILTDLGMEVLDGTDLYVAHPSVAGVADAIAGWLGTPELAVQ